MESVVFHTSLIAAFIAGMVALFAPCCITFLLPAYLGNVFKEKEKILFMTLVFGAGIFVVLLPAVLGVAFVSKLLYRYHDNMYLFAGIAMLLISVVSFLGIKLPMPQVAGRNMEGKPDIISVFTLGIFSGITSACCAPVLIGILTFAFLSPSFLGALLIGAMYVFGMVVPLLIISAFLSGKMPKAVMLKRPIFNISLFEKQYKIILSNAIAGVIFFITGVITVIFTLTGRLSMGKMGGFTGMIQNAGGFVNQYVGGNLIINLLFLILIFYLLYKTVKGV